MAGDPSEDDDTQGAANPVESLPRRSHRSAQQSRSTSSDVSMMGDDFEDEEEDPRRVVETPDDDDRDDEFRLDNGSDRAGSDDEGTHKTIASTGHQHGTGGKSRTSATANRRAERYQVGVDTVEGEGISAPEEAVAKAIDWTEGGDMDEEGGSDESREDGISGSEDGVSGSEDGGSVSADESKSEDDDTSIKEVKSKRKGKNPGRAPRNSKKEGSKTKRHNIADENPDTAALLRIATPIIRCIAASEDPFGLTEGVPSLARRAWAAARKSARALKPSRKVKFVKIVSCDWCLGFLLNGL